MATGAPSVKSASALSENTQTHWMDEEAIEPVAVAYGAGDSGVFVRFRDGLTGFIPFERFVASVMLDELLPEQVVIEPYGKAISIPMKNGEDYDIDPLVVRSYLDVDTKHRLKQLEVKYAKEWGDRIRALRKSERWTQVELSSRSGLDQAVISKLERGIHYPRPETLEKIARAFSLPVIDMLTEEEDD